MNQTPRICKRHGILSEDNIRKLTYKGYEVRQCRLCNEEADKKKRANPEYKRKRLLNSQSPQNREKQKEYANNYRERRRVVAIALYHKKKNDPDFIEKNKIWRKNQYEKMKEGLTDLYIKKTLKIHKDATPEMIESKRLEIIEFRKLRDEIKLNKALLAKNRERIKREREEKGIIKTCSIHGGLRKEETYFVKNGKKTENKIYTCKFCKDEKNKENYFKNIDKIKERQKLYSQNNKESVRNRSRKWYENLSDAYVRRYFTKNSKIKPEHISAELIELKRSLMLLKRKVKEQTKSLENGEPTNAQNK